MNASRTLALAVATGALVVSSSALAEPRVGAAVPSFAASDLHGAQHASRELSRRRTLVIACTSADARHTADQWRHAAQRQFGRDVRVVTLVALRLPFFVPDALVRDRAQPQVERPRWSDTWLDLRGAAQNTLGLRDGSSVPYVFVVDETGRVAASVHAGASDPAAQNVWAQLRATGAAVAGR